MAHHVFEFAEVATAYRYASQWWRSVVGAVDETRWDQAALGEWSVRELVAHTARAYKTVIEYAEGEVKDPTPIDTAAGYFRIVLAEQTPHVHIAARAKREAAEHDDWVVVTDELAAVAGRLVDDLAPDHTMHLFVGEMRLHQYLATRVVELVVHGLDLAAAIDLPTTPPAESAKVALTVLYDLAEPDDVAAVLRLLTGRPASLPLTNALG
ncbi:hypothetical protein BH23ACT2_BH23ACT2_20990 [soil metagenome]